VKGKRNKRLKWKLFVNKSANTEKPSINFNATFKNQEKTSVTGSNYSTTTMMTLWNRKNSEDFLNKLMSS